MTKEELLKAFEDDGDIDYEVIEEDDWIQDGKYQYCTTIIKYDGKYYQVKQSRSGSYHTDWYYNDSFISEVVKEEKVITKTVVVWKPA